ncbi:S-layer homology domain-containing protein [Cohnella sp. WQ 127256]|uniref:S-layer homology domain-containing protein n=1 Tax=Cohnella sp. WQ 127256 TaxID=2938790 RepID=UPI002117F89F|nr:S-layer homology domain-containing protein [Cohnella sp. WQ 127256]
MYSKLVKRGAVLLTAAMLVGTIPAYAAAAEATAVVTSATDVAQPAIIHYVNSEDPTKASSVATFLANPKVYTKDGKSYFRVDIQQVYDVTLTVAGKEGTKVAEYQATVQGRNGAQEVTYFTYDYGVESLSEIIKANTTYMVPGVFTEPQAHDLYLVINNDIDGVIKQLGTAIVAAESAEPKTEPLTKALASAKKVNNLLAKKADIEAALAALTKVASESPTNAQVYYVNDSDPSKISSMAAYIANPKTYAKDGVSYLRIDVMQKYDVKVSVEGKEGTKVAEHTATVQGRQGSEEVTFFTFDYAVKDLNTAFTASASYFVPGVFTEPQSHSISVVVNHNIDAELATIQAKITLAEAAVEQTDALKATVEKAKQAISYLNAKSNIQNATDALVEALSKVNVFTDTEKHWAKPNISQAYAQGIVNGYVNGSYAPDRTMTRAEFTKLVVTGLNLPAAKQELTFADKDQIAAWATDSVKNAVAAGVITGYGDNTFAPGKNISRAELAVMVVKALKLSVDKAPKLTFEDAAGIPEYAKPYVAIAVEKGLVNGVGKNKFAPAKAATRAEATAIVLRAASL